jgi:hypothetical protein
VPLRFLIKILMWAPTYDCMILRSFAIEYRASRYDNAAANGKIKLTIKTMEARELSAQVSFFLFQFSFVRQKVRAREMWRKILTRCHVENIIVALRLIYIKISWPHLNVRSGYYYC